MKTKIFIFFSLVSCFCAFADYGNCYELRGQILNHAQSISASLSLINEGASYIISENRSHQNVGTIYNTATEILFDTQDAQYSVGQIYAFASSIDCSTNDTCSVDLYPLLQVVSNIYDVVYLQSSIFANCYTNLHYIYELFEVGNVHTLIRPDENDSWSVAVQDDELYVYIASLTNQFASSNAQILDNFRVVSNLLFTTRLNLSTFASTFDAYYEDFDNWAIVFLETLQTINDNFLFIYDYMDNMNNYIVQYLPYIKTISDDLKLLVQYGTNSTVSIDQAYTNMFRYSNLLGFDRFRYYAQGQLKNTQVSLYPLSPYDTLQNLRNATIYDAVAAGFESLLISQGSINNYLYWLQAVAGSNRLSVVDSHIMAISNLVYRLDDYVLSDFSNEIASISYKLSFVTNQVDYTTNLVEITNLLQTNNNHLASIDSKLDVLDYIKILSDTPLADYGGDIDYFDYLTNLYLSGVSSSGASTNWFERMEILLASLVFGDSDGTNDIPQSVEMQGFDTDRVSDTMSDFAFSEDFSTSVDNLSQTSRNFMQVLNGYSSALHAVSAPATVSIGTGGIDGSDTSSFEDMMHGHFQVSFNTGTSDRFTVVVRAVTTMSWVLLTMIFIWHCGFWILQKIQFLYRLMRLLINSIWLKS